MEKKFNKKDLLKAIWQYKIVHGKTEDFIPGNIVFLKSSPGYPMVVAYKNDTHITCVWDKFVFHFSPAVLLIKDEMALLTVYLDNIKKRVDVCLN